MIPGGFPQIGITVENKSDDDATWLNMDAHAKLFPYEGPAISTFDYIALDGKMEPELLAELESGTDLKVSPFKGGLSAKNKISYSLLGDRPVTEDDIRKHAEGKLVLAAIGKLRYKDSPGCVYESEFCGFFAKADWSFAHCKGGHFEQAVRTTTKYELN